LNKKALHFFLIVYHLSSPSTNTLESDNNENVKFLLVAIRVTLIVATSASSAKILLFMVGKLEQPERLRLCPEGKPPMYYTHQTKHGIFECLPMGIFQG
jgi:hypothetical protein